jgi:hypothetical protein
VERGHGQELPHCPLCLAKLDDVKYHKCSAGAAAHASVSTKFRPLHMYCAASALKVPSYYRQRDFECEVVASSYHSRATDANA